MMKKYAAFIISCLVLVSVVLTFVIVKNNIEVRQNNERFRLAPDGETYDPSEHPEKFTAPESEFCFAPRKTFASRQEVLDELDRIDDYYYEYTYGRDVENCALAKEKCSEISKEVAKKLNEFPTSDDEILAEKERVLDQEVGMCGDDVIYGKSFWNPAMKKGAKCQNVLINYF